MKFNIKIKLVIHTHMRKRYSSILKILNNILKNNLKSIETLMVSVLNILFG